MILYKSAPAESKQGLKCKLGTVARIPEVGISFSSPFKGTIKANGSPLCPLQAPHLGGICPELPRSKAGDGQKVRG